MTTLADLYPSRGPTETVTERCDPVVWPASGAEAPGPFSRTDLASYERDGFLTLDFLVTPPEVAALKAEIQRMIEDPERRGDERTVIEPDSREVRSIFEVHKLSGLFADLVRDERLADRARPCPPPGLHRGPRIHPSPHWPPNPAGVTAGSRGRRPQWV